MAKKKKSILKEIKDFWTNAEGKKNRSYFDSPMDHPDVDSIKEIDEKKRGVKYSDKEIRFKNDTGLDGPKMSKQREKAKRFVDSVQGMMARKSTAKEGSFKNGGSIKIKGNGIAKRGNNFKGIF